MREVRAVCIEDVLGHFVEDEVKELSPYVVTLSADPETSARASEFESIKSTSIWCECFDIAEDSFSF
jgi:hypothetical protein